MFAGAAIFCVMGYMAEMLGKDVKDVATSGQLCNNLRTPRGSGVISTVLEHKRVVSSMRKSLEHDTHSDSLMFFKCWRQFWSALKQ